MRSAARPQPRLAHNFAKEPHGHVDPTVEPWKHATQIGAAGEHLVCADLLLKGYRASLAAAGLAYDLILDDRGKLLRIAVKSILAPRRRPAREANRLCYQFTIRRPRKLRNGKTDARPYTEADADIIAFCALDVRHVAYCQIGECAGSMHFDVLDALPPKNNRGIFPPRPRKTFENYTIERAIEVHLGLTPPLPFKWRRNR